MAIAQKTSKALAILTAKPSVTLYCSLTLRQKNQTTNYCDLVFFIEPVIGTVV